MKSHFKAPVTLAGPPWAGSEQIPATTTPKNASGAVGGLPAPLARGSKPPFGWSEMRYGMKMRQLRAVEMADKVDPLPASTNVGAAAQKLFEQRQKHAAANERADQRRMQAKLRLERAMATILDHLAKEGPKKLRHIRADTKLGESLFHDAKKALEKRGAIRPIPRPKAAKSGGGFTVVDVPWEATP